MPKNDDHAEPAPGQNAERNNSLSVCYLKPGERLREGMLCPRCQSAKMMYNGMLNLVCPNCGLTEAGACT